MTGIYNADKLTFDPNNTDETEPLQHNIEQTARYIDDYENLIKTGFMCFNQDNWTGR